MTAYLTVIGRNIRDNLHRASTTELAPILGLYENGSIRYGFGAVIHGAARTIYTARADQQEVCGAEVFIKTDARIELTTQAVQPPVARSHFIHTNTHHAKSNRALLKGDTTTLAFKPVVAVRATKSAKAQMCMEVLATGISYVIYAAPSSRVAPMGCGARVWQQVVGTVVLTSATSDNATTESDMDDMDEIGQIMQAAFL